MNNSFKIEGLDCANCARELEEEIKKLGIDASVDFMAQKVYADCDEKTLQKVKDICNRFEEVKVVEEVENERGAGEIIKIKNLCCANCARELEEELNKIDGVTASVDFINLRITLNSTSPEARDKAIYSITHFEDVKIVDGGKRESVLLAHLKDIICLSISLVLFIPALVLDFTISKENFAARISTYVLYSLAYISAGYPVLINTVKNLLKGKVFDENFLMTVASLGAVALGIFAGDGFMEGVAVMFLYRLGELLQSIAVGSSRNSISALMELKSDTATIVEDGVQRVISPDELKVGDIIIIKAGEKVPVDCKVEKGATSLDMKSLNGEPLPREVKEGDEILSGSVNISGVIYAEVLREYKNSAVAKILELVENSTAKKSGSEKFITKFAKYYTPAVCIAAILVAAIVPTVICAVAGEYLFATYSDWIYKALGFLVISCPCALVISVPLSYFYGIGRCAKYGILVKGSTCLDELALSKYAAFDKTGTLTEGVFGIKNYTNEKTLNLAAAAEKFSNHPIARAFTSVNTPYEGECAEEIAGKGIRCKVEGKTLLCGNLKFLEENDIKAEKADSISTIVYVAYDGKFSGTVEIDDKIKSGAKEAIAALKEGGIAQTIMLTGDSKERAEDIAAKVGIDKICASLLPDEKLKEAEKLQKDGKLLYVGDGINDAPVMISSDCGISMGSVGSDAAIEASDIVLVSDDLSLIPTGRKIAKRTRSIVMQNIAGSLIIKAVIMALDIAIPAFPLIVSVVADVGVMLLAVINAMRTALVKK